MRLFGSSVSPGTMSSVIGKRKLGLPVKRNLKGANVSSAELPRIKRTEDVRASQEYKERRAEKNAAFLAARKLSIKPGFKLNDMLQSVKKLPKTTTSSSHTPDAEVTTAPPVEPPSHTQMASQPPVSTIKDSRPLSSKASPYLRR